MIFERTIMSLKDVGGAQEGLTFANNGIGPDLIQKFRKFSWSSFEFETSEVWASQQLTHFAFRLSGGQFVTSGDPAQPNLEILEDDVSLYESLNTTDLEFLLEVIKDFYIESLLSVGVDNGATIPVLCERVNRCWSAFGENERRDMVGRCLDGLTLREVSGTAMRPLASLLNKLGVRSKLGAFSGSGIQASTSKKRMLHFFRELAPPSTVNGLICMAASPDDGMNLLLGNWTEEKLLDLEVEEAAAICHALSLAPTSSASAPRFLALTFKEAKGEHEVPVQVPGVALFSEEPSPSDLPFQGAPAVPELTRPAPIVTPTPAVSGSKTRQQRKKKTAVAASVVHQALQLGDGDDVSDSDSGDEEANESSILARHLTELLAPPKEVAKSGQALSSSAVRVIHSLPTAVQTEFTELVDKHRTTVVSKKDLESLRSVFLANRTAEEMLLARRPLPDKLLEDGVKTIHPLYQSTRLGFPAHLSILAQELTVRTAGGRSLETSLAEKQALIKDESLRQEHTTVSELLVLLLDEVHPKGVLSLRTAERMMRRLVGLEIAAENKGKMNHPLHKTLTELSEFMGTGTRISAAAQSQLP